jgi:hypothetical protein
MTTQSAAQVTTSEGNGVTENQQNQRHREQLRLTCETGTLTSSNLSLFAPTMQQLTLIL